MRFPIKQGDTSPALALQLQDENGDPVDISGYNEVRFIMSDISAGTTKVDDDTAGNVSVTDQKNGDVKYEWASVDTDTVAYYQAEFEVEYGDGTKETFPNVGYITVEVREDLD